VVRVKFLACFQDGPIGHVSVGIRASALEIRWYLSSIVLFCSKKKYYLFRCCSFSFSNIYRVIFVLSIISSINLTLPILCIKKKGIQIYFQIFLVTNNPYLGNFFIAKSLFPGSKSLLSFASVSLR